MIFISKTNTENESTWTKIMTCNEGTDTIRIRKVETEVEAFEATPPSLKTYRTEATPPSLKTTDT